MAPELGDSERFPRDRTNSQKEVLKSVRELWFVLKKLLKGK